jgi:arsenical pump membrane protein
MMDDLCGDPSPNFGSPFDIPASRCQGPAERNPDLLALAIFLITLVFVIVQPKGLGIGWSATGGALLALATGTIHLRDIPVVWHIVWDATFTFVALILISLLLDEAGFFHWAAIHIARFGGGSGRRLFPLIVLLGAGISAVFANDGAALLLTPIVLALLLRMDISPRGALAFIIATGFIADTASLPFMISNLVNIIVARYFHLPFDRYAAVMVPVDIVAILATLVALWILFGHHLPERYHLEKLPDPKSVIRDPVVFRAGIPLLAAILVSYFLTARIHLPAFVIMSVAALILLVLAARWHRPKEKTIIDVLKVLKEAPWQIVLFSLSMYLVVYGLKNAGLTSSLSGLLSAIGTHGVVAASVGMGFLAAFLSSVMNNLPAVLVGTLSIHEAQGVTEPVRQAFVYANIIGCDLGPKLTPIGSLATLLWLHVLARKGEKISWGEYIRIGVLLTPPILLVTLLALALWLKMVG